MMNRLGFLVLMALTTTANASEINSDLKNCTKLTDSLARLVCFDNLAEKVEKESASVKAEKQKEDVALAAGKTVTTDKVVAAAPISVTTAPIPVIKSESEQIEEFGFEHIKKPEDGNMESILLIVSSVRKTSKSRLIVAFENGQKWEQKDGKWLSLKVGDQAKIKKGAFGAIYLSKVGNNRNIRVKRLK